MRRVLYGCLAIAVMIVLAVVFRIPLAQGLADVLLAESGLPNPRVTISSLNWNRAEIDRVAVGLQDEVQLHGVTLNYRPAALIDGTLDRIVIQRADVRLDLTGKGHPLGSFAAFLGEDSTETADAKAPPLPKIVLNEVAIQADTLGGPVALVSNGLIEPDVAGAVTADLMLQATGFGASVAGALYATLDAGQTLDARLTLEQGHIGRGDQGLTMGDLGGTIEATVKGTRPERVKGRLTFEDLNFAGQPISESTLALDLIDSALSLAIDARLPDGDVSLSGRGGLAEDFSLSDAQVDVTASLGPKALLWSRLPLPTPPTSGKVAVTGHFAGDLPPATTLGDLEPLLWLEQNKSRLTGQLALSDFTLPGWVEGLSIDLDSEIQGSSTGIRAVMAKDGEVRLEALDPGLAPIVETLREMSDEPLSLVLSKGSSFSLDLTDTWQPQALEWDGQATVRAEQSAAIETNGPVTFTFPDGDEPATLTLAAFDVDGTFGALSKTPLTGLSFEGVIDGQVRIPTSQSPTGVEANAEHDLTARFSKIDATLANRAGLPVSLRIKAPRLSIDSTANESGELRLEAKMSAGQVGLPDQALRMDGIDLSAVLSDGGLKEPLTFAVAQIEDQTKPPRFAPIRVSGRVVPVKDRYQVEAEVFGPKDAGPLNLSGDIWPDQARAHLDISLAAVTFSPSGLQPKDLSDQLKGLSDVAGTVGLTGSVDWRDSNPAGQATIALDDVSLTYNGTKFEGLDGTIALDRLPTIASPPDQRITLRSVDPGIPVKDVTLDFQLLPGEPVKVLIQSAAFRSAGGQFRLGRTLFDPALPKTTADLQIVVLDLEELLADYPVEGLAATGRLAGHVPMTLRTDGFEIGEAALTAESPGVLKYYSETTKQALQGGGESVELMLQALEDFRYDELRIFASKDLEQNAELRFEILGNNPSVLDGYPFRFNINLSGNIASLMAAILQGLAISDDLIQRSWKLRP